MAYDVKLGVGCSGGGLTHRLSEVKIIFSLAVSLVDREKVLAQVFSFLKSEGLMGARVAVARGMGVSLQIFHLVRRRVHTFRLLQSLFAFK